MNALPTRVLIIEDNALAEAPLLCQLEKADLHTQVKVIADGSVAISYLSDEEHHAENLVAIFLDLQLPTLAGVHLLEAIRSHERTRHLPVILMTSSNAPEMERCRALGISSSVSKPVTFSTFASAVANTFHSDKRTTPQRMVAA